MRFFVLLLLSLPLNYIYAQQRAITDRGEQVVLYNDGTWKFLEGEAQVEKEIPTNSKRFVKEENASFLLKSSSRISNNA